MKKSLTMFVAIAAFATGVLFTTAFAPAQTEAQEHPRIAKAIEAMEDALAYMEKAPHDFGGHKAVAMADTRAAIKSLKLALAYRTVKDHK